MPIYDQTFRRYTGPRNLKMLWWPVAWFTFRPIIKRKTVWLLLLGFILFLGYISLSFFVVAKMQEFIPDAETRRAARTIRKQGIKLFGPDIPLGTVIYNVMQPIKGLVWLLAMIAGAGAISSDKRHNALPLYFSRPLKPWHYTFGKLLGVSLMPIAAVLITQWLLGIQYIAWYLPFSAFFTSIPTFLLAALYGLTTCGFVALAITAISSSAKSSRIAGVMFLLFFVLTGRLIPMIAHNARMDNLLALSPTHALDKIGQALLTPNLETIDSTIPTGGLSTTAAIAAMAGYTLFFAWMFRRNLRVVEVVK